MQRKGRGTDEVPTLSNLPRAEESAPRCATRALTLPSSPRMSPKLGSAGRGWKEKSESEEEAAVAVVAAVSLVGAPSAESLLAATWGVASMPSSANTRSSDEARACSALGTAALPSAWRASSPGGAGGAASGAGRGEGSIPSDTWLCTICSTSMRISARRRRSVARARASASSPSTLAFPLPAPAATAGADGAAPGLLAVSGGSTESASEVVRALLL